MAIDFKGKHLLIGTSKECRVWLVDQSVVTNTDPEGHHMDMIDRSALICNPGARFDAAGVWGAMATWVENNQLYIAVPFLGPLADTWPSTPGNGTPYRGGVAVLKVDDSTPKWKMVPAWTYGDIDQGDEAIYMNGVLFVNGAGEDTYQQSPDIAFNESPRIQGQGQSGGRIANSRHATLYAFDASNGKLLWSSGDQITSWNHGSGMTAVNGKAYIGTFDGNFYCFGVGK
jgi:outer membrane protein assembly factor BamB